ncbi:MAG: hypothetical protein APR55_04265 [Methanolinea sp. SDB]|nr:MAG: hypothetical protein APR55_04265 [Methanolinea sp. SDB]
MAGEALNDRFKGDPSGMQGGQALRTVGGTGGVCVKIVDFFFQDMVEQTRYHMSEADGAGMFIGHESEDDYLDREMKEYLVGRERNMRKLHFNYSRKRWSARELPGTTSI